MVEESTYRFIDLFAGIGGFHVAFNNTGRAQCEFASEWDPHARKTYRHWFNKGSDKKLFKDDEKLFKGDITKVSPKDIPDFDILCGGFPCQPFSQAGQKKGFSDTRGTLFFNIEKIIKIKKPRAFFLENVRGLMKHGGDSSTEGIGKTLETIHNKLFKNKNEGGLGYHPPKNSDGPDGVFLVKASDYGLPQHRPRVFIIGFSKKKYAKKFKLPEKFKLDDKRLGGILGGETFFDAAGKKPRSIGFTLRCGGKGSPINDRRNWEHYYVKTSKNRKPVPVKITHKEGLLLNGFPDDFEFPENVGITQRMKQLGNSVAVNAVQAWGESIITALDS